MIASPSGRVFECEVERIDVTCLHRPDDAWAFTDAAGHEHRWHFDGKPGTYRPQAKADVPTLKWVRTGTGYYEDGEPYAIGHHECRECGEHVTPQHTADSHRQYVPGLRYYSIDGQSVDEATFRAEAEKEWPDLQIGG
jgi:hypothetical protein